MDDGDDPPPTARQQLRRWAPALIPILATAWIIFICILVATMPPVE